MKSLDKISEKDLKVLSLMIKKNVFTPVRTYETSIFLCGADLNNTTKIRYKISKILEKELFFVDIIYPEDLFEEFLYSGRGNNLLSLEEVLAKSVDVVIIIPESPGSFAELGAFANNASLIKKLICVSEKKYAKNKSFLNLGPIKLIRQENKNNVFYLDFSNNLSEDIDRLVKSIRRLKRNSNKIKKELHLLQLENFLMPCIYVFEPIGVEEIVALVKFSLDDEKFYKQSTFAALNILLKKQFVSMSAEGYRLTSKGLNHYKIFLDNHYDSSRIKKYLDKIRLEVLNFQLRGKPIKI